MILGEPLQYQVSRYDIRYSNKHTDTDVVAHVTVSIHRALIC